MVDLGSEGLCGAAFVGTDDLHMITGCDDGRICVRKLDNLEDQGAEVRRVDRHPIHCVAASPLREQYAIGDKSGGVHVSTLYLI